MTMQLYTPFECLGRCNLTSPLYFAQWMGATAARKLEDNALCYRWEVTESVQHWKCAGGLETLCIYNFRLSPRTPLWDWSLLRSYYCYSSCLKEFKTKLVVVGSVASYTCGIINCLLMSMGIHYGPSP